MLSVTQSYLDQFNAPVRQSSVRIGLIEQCNFNLPDDVAISAGSSGDKSEFTPAEAVVDGTVREPAKYWVLNCGMRLNQGWRLWGAGGQKFNHGWWSDVKSDDNGEFANPPWIELTFSPAVNANMVKIATTAVYAGVSRVRLSLQYEGDAGYAVWGTLDFGNEYSVVAEFGDVKAVEKIKVEVLSTKNARDYARITEVEPVLEWSPSTSPVTPHLLRYSVVKSSGSSDYGSPHAPGIGVNQLELEFSRDILETASVDENQIITISQGFGNDVLPVGRFIILGEMQENKSSISCRAYSRLQLSKFYHFPDYVFVQAKTSQIIRSVLNVVGIPDEDIEFHLSSDAKWSMYGISGTGLDRVLQDFADHFGVAIYEDEEGKVHIRSSYGNPVTTLGDDIIAELNVTSAATINAVVVNYSIMRLEPEDEVWSLPDDTEIGAGATVSIVFPLDKTPALNLRPLEAQDIAPVIVESWSSNGFWLSITLHNPSGGAAVIPRGSLVLRGRPVSMSPTKTVEARNDTSIRRLGRREYQVTLYCGSDSQASAIASRMLNYLGNSARYEVELNRPMPHLQVRDVVRIDSDHFDLDAQVVVTEIRLDERSTHLTCLPKEAVA